MDAETKERYELELRSRDHWTLPRPLHHATHPLHHTTRPLHHATRPSITPHAPSTLLPCRTQLERTFLSQLIKQFFSILDSIPGEGDVHLPLINYCERFLELMADLEVSTQKLHQCRNW